MKIIFYSCLLLLASCASLQPKEFLVEIDLATLNSENKPIDAVCSLYSSSSKLDVLSPAKIVFKTECSSINVVCKAGDLYGTHGVIKETNNSQTENMIITSGIGYLFDRVVDTITPMGTLMNFMSYEQASCDLERKIIVVLE
tara:strand:+ start:67 stop:492 length:426 start_codon:yes stop_codon:yes gene_type:complete